MPEKRRILVTGGTGFTGAALVRRLLELGHEVRVLDKQKGRASDELESAGAEILLGSVTDEELARKAVQGCEVVFHVAATFRDVNVSHAVYWDVNVNGTKTMARVSLEEGVDRFVHCSTEGVHGKVTNPPADEDAPIRPQDYYEYSKWEAEKALKPFTEKGLRTVVLRPTAIYGPGDPERFFMIFRRVSKGTFPMFGTGETFYHPVYIDNLVQAFVLAMDCDAAIGETFLVADENPCTIEDLVRRTAKSIHVNVNVPHFPFWALWIPSVICEAVCKPLGIKPPLFPRRADWFRKTRAFDIGKAKRILGYDPKIGLDEGLARTARWYEEQGMLPKRGAPGA